MGKEAVALNPGIQLGVVSDVIFDPLLGIVLGFVLDAPGWHVEARVIPWSGVFSVSSEQVVALSATMVVRAGQLYSMSRVLERSPLWLGMPAHDDSGRWLGLFHSVYFAPDTGRIRGCGLSTQPGAPAALCRQLSSALRVQSSGLVFPTAPDLLPDIGWPFRLAATRMQLQPRTYHHNVSG